MQTFLQNDPNEAPDSIAPPADIVFCSLDEIRPHPSYERHRLAASAPQLSALAERPDFGLSDPLLITRDKILIDGYARLKLARLKGYIELPCIQYEIDEVQALHMLLRTHCRLPGFVPFSRVVMALDLEPALKAQARLNQRLGGHTKGSSNLTEAEKIDVREDIANVAHVSVGNVSKVKYLLGTACPELLQALRNGEVHIHRAWKWSKHPAAMQKQFLWEMRTAQGIKKTIGRCIARHRRKRQRVSLTLRDLVSSLSASNTRALDSISVHVIEGSSDAVFLTQGLLQQLGLEQKEIL